MSQIKLNTFKDLFVFYHGKWGTGETRKFCPLKGPMYFHHWTFSSPYAGWGSSRDLGVEILPKTHLHAWNFWESFYWYRKKCFLKAKSALDPWVNGWTWIIGELKNFYLVSECAQKKKSHFAVIGNWVILFIIVLSFAVISSIPSTWQVISHENSCFPSLEHKSLHAISKWTYLNPFLAISAKYFCSFTRLNSVSSRISKLTINITLKTFIYYPPSLFALFLRIVLFHQDHFGRIYEIIPARLSFYLKKL